MSCPRAHPALTQHFILQHTHDHKSGHESGFWFADHHLLTLQFSPALSRLKKTASIKLYVLTANTRYKWIRFSSASSSPWHWRWISFLHFNQMSESFREWYALFYITLPSQAAYPCNVENPVAGTLCVPRASSRAGYFREANPKSTKIHLGYPLSSIFV